ncbi:MAG: septum formation initiator family protein [Spirochaetales bacterium]|nr:septum formation initiator family protein [Spirochaetales bacterium]
MKRLLLIVPVVFVPVLLFLNVWQSFRYWEVEREIQELEQVQIELFQENKLAAAGIGYLHSPFMIDEVARESLGLKKSVPGQVIHVRIKRSGTAE